MDMRRTPYAFGPSFSLRTLLVCVLVACVVLGAFSYWLHQAKLQTAAVQTIREMGGVVPFVNLKDGSGVKEIRRVEKTLLVKLLGLDLFITYPRVDLRDPSLSEDDIRAMIPYIRRLIPVEGMNVAGKSFVALDVHGNPNISERLIRDMQEELPNCRFSKVTSVPSGVEKFIDIGMTAGEVVDAVGEVWLQEMVDWVWDSAAQRKRLKRKLGSSHRTYINPNGRESWTYFADDLGIAVFGIDFDADGRVVGTWYDRGSPPPGRQLTLVTNEEE